MGSKKKRNRRQDKKKIGRNAPCPCGSKKKYKNCHGITTQTTGFLNLSPEVEADINVKLSEMEARRRQQEKQQGLGNPIISISHMGTRFVAVGSRLHYSKKWKTFHDFLLDYVKIVMGEEWGTAEIHKDLAQRHPILQWYDLICRYQKEKIKDPGKPNDAPMTGALQVLPRLGLQSVSFSP